MKKFLFIIFFLFLIEVVSPSPVSAVTCGDDGTATICGATGGCPEGSYCTQDEYWHCTIDTIYCRSEITPTLTPAPSITITPTTTPSTPPVPFPTLEIPDTVSTCKNLLSKDETIYPPNSACYAETKRTQTEIGDYPKTCIKEPTASYEDTRYITDEYGYANCFGKDGGNCDIYITVTTDVSKAELGSYGPDSNSLSSSPADSLAKKYLFNSLFDRPYSNNTGIARENWRTYWRLLPVYEQFNLVAQFINLVNLNAVLDNSTLKQINNTKWQYLDSAGNTQETTVKDLISSLPGCLKTEPVCPDFATKYNDLNANTKAAFDTMIPLSFNNLRGFIAILPPVFPDRTPIPGTVVRESVPYVEAIFQGLLSNKYGLLGNLQPSWLSAKSQTGLTDSNTGYNLSTGKDGYISGQFGTINFDDSTLNAPVLAQATIESCPDFPDVYSLSAPRTFPKNTNNTDGSLTQEIRIKGSTLKWEIQKTPADHVCVESEWQCIFPGTYKWISGHYQCSPSYYYQEVCADWDYVCDSPLNNCSESPINGSDEECCQFKVTGNGKGKAITVLNNPKTTDIKQSVIGNPSSSLYNTIIPNAFLAPTPTDKKINAPTSSTSLIGTAYTGIGSLTSPGSSIIRENNLAQDTMHLIQNCWLVPSDQQSSSKCGKATSNCDSTILPDLSISDPACGLCNDSLSNLAGLVDDNVSSLFPEGKMPDLMKKILQKAGETFGVPASTIFGTMYHEGAFSGNRYQWTEENVKNWSICGGTMPLCDKNSSVTQPPYGWIPYWFYEGDGAYALWNAVQTIDPSRTKNIISPCNFLDATFATAKALKMWSGTNVSGYSTCCQPDTACYSLDSTGPTSCSGWTLDDVAQSNVGYGGYCPEEGKRGIYPSSNFIEQTITRHQALKCY